MTVIICRHQLPYYELLFSCFTQKVHIVMTLWNNTSDQAAFTFGLSVKKTTKHFLTHWGRVTHICVSKLTIIGSDNGLSPGRRQAIIWTNAGILLIWPLGTNFSEILIEIQTFSLKKMRLKMSSAKCFPLRLGFNVLISRARWNSEFFGWIAFNLNFTNMS